ncbi:MAG: hypothetical protein CEE40_05525 [Chloroflexi bacterium B3_Chlor]|nr:MAG: hypothetical protein CEE40_05525 [Chloroflexi bacterium B3_Chlor]
MKASGHKRPLARIRITARPVSRRWHTLSWRRLLLLAIIVLMAAAAPLALSACGATRQAPQTPVQSASSAAAVEERFGIRVTLLGVTADGGLIDLRFQVVDADKAATMLEPGNLPVLIAEDSGVELKLSPRSDVAHLEAGRVYYLLYPNAQNAIKPGTKVTVVMGGLRLEHLTAQ